MTLAANLLQQAHQYGIDLHVEGDAIHMQADFRPPTHLLANLKAHKAELIALLAGPPPLSEEAKVDIRETLEERAAIQEFDGCLSREDADAAAIAAMRIFRYRLAGGRGWCMLNAPGWSLEDAERDLQSRYGGRLLEVVEHKPVRRQEASHV